MQRGTATPELQLAAQALPRTLLSLNVANNALATLDGLQCPNLVWLDASSNQLKVLWAAAHACSHSSKGGGGY